MRRYLVSFLALAVSSGAFAFETCSGKYRSYPIPYQPGGWELADKDNYYVSCFDGTSDREFVLNAPSDTRFLYQMAAQGYRFLGSSLRPDRPASYSYYYFQKD